MDWTLLMDGARRKERPDSRAPLYDGPRTEFERDQDRILFSTPFRRLIDKTQVFPLEKKYDTVRRRLTHSIEVGNLARSIGTDIAFNHSSLFPTNIHPQRNIPAMLAAIGLAHDLGNPPFGHQGENAIREWFQRKQDQTRGTGFWIFDGLDENSAMVKDFLNFEGNAQTFRLVTKLQLLNDNCGLNLTYGTLSALLKYVLPSDRTHKGNFAATKKPGYFYSERKQVVEVQTRTGTGEFRHPLTFIMEACDDIAYTLLDAEDAAKKRLLSFADIAAHLKQLRTQDKVTDDILKDAEKDHVEFIEEFRRERLSPSELNDISMQMFRVRAFQHVVPRITEAFVLNEGKMRDSSFQGDLLKATTAGAFFDAMKHFDRVHAYRNKEVLGIELTGFNVISGLMDLYWEAITQRKGGSADRTRRGTPFANYAYERISENYRRVFDRDQDGLPLRYRELQLLTDMVSGMPDSYAVDIYRDLKSRRHET